MSDSPSRVSHTPDGTELWSVLHLVEQHGIPATLAVMAAAGISGPDAVRHLRNAGVSDLEIEAAAIAIEDA